MNTLEIVMLALAGLCIGTASGMRSQRRRMVAAPITILWSTFWALQAARSLDVTNRTYLIGLAIGATAISTVIAFTIPYMLEERRKRAN